MLLFTKDTTATLAPILVLNTVIKMQKNEFCLNFYTNGRNTNKAPLNEFIWLRDAFNGRYNTAFISDANAATTSGFYRYYANSANTPWAGGGTLFTLAFDGGSGIVQITFFNGSPAAASLRARYNNTWTGWKAL